MKSPADNHQPNEKLLLYFHSGAIYSENLESGPDYLKDALFEEDEPTAGHFDTF